jgi:hypothetical protein
MPLNLPDFLRAPLQKNNFVQNDYSAIENFLPNLQDAYNKPIQMKNEREMAKHDLEAKRIANAFLEREKEAKLNLMGAQAEHYRNPLSTTQRDLMSIYGQNTPEFQNAMKREYGIYDNQETSINESEGVPPEVRGRRFDTMPKSAQNEAMKNMRSNLRIAQSQAETLPIIQELKSVIEENPNLWKSYSLILENPNDSGTIEYIKKNFGINEKDKTALDKFGKLAGDLIVTGGESFGSGGQKFTDARQDLLKSIKPSERNTDAANLFVLNNLEKKASGAPAYANSLRQGLKEGYEIIPNPDLFRKLAEKTPQAGSLGMSGGTEFAGQPVGPDLSQGAQDMVTIRNKKTGETKLVPRAEAALRAAQ